MRAFFLAFAGVLAIALSTLAAINYFVDVNRVYHSEDPAERHFIGDYVERLGEASQGMTQIPAERAFKWEFAQRTNATCFITGSSRVMPFGLTEMKHLGAQCSSLANIAVSGAGFEDFVTAAGLLVDKPKIETIFIGVDPWAFRRDADIRYTEFEKLLDSGRRRLGLAPRRAKLNIELYVNLINGQYFMQNLRALFSTRSQIEPKVVLSGGTNLAASDNVTRPDGSLFYSRSYRARLPVAYNLVGNGSVKIQWPFIDPAIGDEFERILALFSDRGTEIVFLIPPYHPKVFLCRSAKACEAMTTVEAWLRALAERRGYKVIGSFDPNSYGIGPDYFYDQLHMDMSAVPLLKKDVSN
jgi:hypothetical protein